MPEDRENGQEQVLVLVSQLLEEAQRFADGEGNHIFYAKEDGPKLVIPPTKDIIDQLVARAKSYTAGVLEAEIEEKIKAIYDTFERNLASSGRQDGYLVNSEDLLYGKMVGG